MSELAGSDILLDYTQDKVVVIDDSGVFQYVNQAADPILGYDPDELLGENAFEYIHPDDRENVRAVFETVITGDEFRDATVKYRHRTADGEWCWLESRFSNCTDSKLGGYVVSSRDISEQITAEKEQATTQSRLEEIANTTNDVLWMFSGDWSELLFVNPAYEQLYGTSVEDLKENPKLFFQSIFPEDRPKVERAMASLSSGEPVDIEYRAGSDDEYDRWVWIQAEPIFSDGEVNRIVGFSRDITDRRRRERQLAVMDNLLRHNLRNDLNVILSAADTIERETDTDVANETRVIRRVGADLLETADKQRDIIKVLTKQTKLSTIDISDAVRGAVRRVQRCYPDAVFDLDLPETAPVRGLPELELAIAELVENAAKHANCSPEIRLSTRDEGETRTITVEDNGPSIPETEYRVLTGEQTMSALYHSSGLGLWLVYWVVTLSDGRISFRNHPPTG